MIDAVEAKAANSLFKPFIRTGIDGGSFGKMRMEASIKYGDLRNGAECFRNDFHAREFGVIVKRSEGRHALDG
jgi:hypothetical protein